MTPPARKPVIPWLTLALGGLFGFIAAWLYPTDPQPIEKYPEQRLWLGAAAFGRHLIEWDRDHRDWNILKAKDLPPLQGYLEAVALSVAGQPVPAQFDFQADPGNARVARWPSLAAVGLIVFALILAGHRLKNLFLGLLVATAVALHPDVRHLAGLIAPDLPALALLLVSFVLTLSSTLELYETRFCVGRWLILLASLSLTIGLAWSADRATGVLAATGTAVSLLLAVFAFLRRRSPQGNGTNAFAALLVAMAAPVAAVGVTRLLDPTVERIADLHPTWIRPTWHGVKGFWDLGLEGAFWIAWWVAGLILVYSWWRTLRRGWKRSRAGTAPVSWGLTIFAILASGVTTLTVPPNADADALARAFTPLIPWCVLLGGFLIFDVLHGLGESLVLAPPDEQALVRKQRVLVLCTGNSCRSQMAEALWRQEAGDRYEVLSAGTLPKGIHPLTIQVLAEVGAPTDELRSKHVKEIDTRNLDLVLTVCGKANQACPVLPGQFRRAHWPIDDPAAADGSADEVLQVFRRVRDEIRQRIRQLVQSAK